MSLWRCQHTRVFLSRTQPPRSHSLHPSALPPAQRALCTSRPGCYPRKDTQSKDSLSPTSTEYTKSGSDDSAAAMQDAAYNPSKTSPEEETRTAGKESNGNPLEVSPGNMGVSQPRAQQEGGASTGLRNKPSGQGSPQKKGGGQSGGGTSGS